jgi:hypothetical protein
MDAVTGFTTAMFIDSSSGSIGPHMGMAAGDRWAEFNV